MDRRSHFQARGNMRKMKKAISILLSHGDEKQVVGIVTGDRRSTPGSRLRSGNASTLIAVTERTEAGDPCKIKGAEVKDMVLVKNARLSVQPVATRNGR